MAGVYVDEQTASQLLTAGVHNSKLLPDTLILSLAEEIKIICQGKGHILSYLPERYNQLYKETPNLNLLLARAHAHIVANLQKRTASVLAIVDQFGDVSLVPTMLQKVGCDIGLEQRTHAEEDSQSQQHLLLRVLSLYNGLPHYPKKFDTVLLKGASDPGLVTVGREIVARTGYEALGRVAKLYFKITQTILRQ